MKKYPPSAAHALARQLRREMTDAERRVWRMLRSRQIEGARFRRQVPIGRYITDFLCHEARLIIEIDGGQHDGASLAEIARTEFLKGQGYRVIRFWNNEVFENLEGVVAEIASFLAASPPPCPPPSWGRGQGTP